MKASKAPLLCGGAENPSFPTCIESRCRLFSILNLLLRGHAQAPTKPPAQMTPSKLRRRHQNKNATATATSKKNNNHHGHVAKNATVHITKKHHRATANTTATTTRGTTRASAFSHTPFSLSPPLGGSHDDPVSASAQAVCRRSRGPLRRRETPPPLRPRCPLHGVSRGRVAPFRRRAQQRLQLFVSRFPRHLHIVRVHGDVFFLVSRVMHAP